MLSNEMNAFTDGAIWDLRLTAGKHVEEEHTLLTELHRLFDSPDQSGTVVIQVRNGRVSWHDGNTAERNTKYLVLETLHELLKHSVEFGNLPGLPANLVVKQLNLAKLESKLDAMRAEVKRP